MKITTFRLILAVAPGICTCAARGAEPASQLDEVVVTAQKRAESIQDVPFSVAAINDESIRKLGATNIVELARNVVGLAITDLGPGQSQVAIRGISSGQVIRDQPGVKESVGVYLDETPISVALFTPDLELFDLQRMEVLRGPQGTLFGAGSESGTVRYITAPPRLNAYEGAIDTQIEGADSEFAGAIKGALNAPVSSTVAVRAVGYYDKLPGFIDSALPGRSTIKDVNDGSKVGGRIAVLLQPSENLYITPRIVYQKLNTSGFPRIDIYNILGNPFTTTEPPVTPGRRGQVRQIGEGLDDDLRLGDLKIDYDFGPASLTSVTSYTDRELFVRRDASALVGSVTFDIGGSPPDVRLNSALDDRTKLRVFSQELRLTSRRSEHLDWLVGAFYQKVNRRYGQLASTPGYDAVTRRLFNIDSATFGLPPDTLFRSDFVFDMRQYAFFGEATWKFTDKWSVTSGLRYYNFNEERVTTLKGFLAQQIDRSRGSTASNGLSPRLITSYHPSANLQFNAQASRGFRLGGINDPLNTPICTPQDVSTFGGHPTWKDETVWNYELGSKTRMAGGKVTFNSSVFYSRIKDLQANLDAGSCSSRVVFNVPNARSAGTEFELFLKPDERWDIGVSATYIDAKLTSSVFPSGGSAPIQGLRSGNRLPTSPRFQSAISISYERPIAAQLVGFADFTVHYVGSSYTQLADQEPGFGTLGPAGFINFGAPTIQSFTFDPKLPAYEIGNLRVGERKGQWTIAAFVNNLWDERALVALDRERARRARIGYLTNTPRTVGVNLRYSF